MSQHLKVWMSRCCNLCGGSTISPTSESCSLSPLGLFLLGRRAIAPQKTVGSSINVLARWQWPLYTCTQLGLLFYCLAVSIRKPRPENLVEGSPINRCVSGLMVYFFRMASVGVLGKLKLVVGHHRYRVWRNVSRELEPHKEPAAA